MTTKLPVWIALVHVAPTPLSGGKALEGRPGAYVNVLATAEDETELATRIGERLARDGLVLRELEDVELLATRHAREPLNEWFLALGDEASQTGDVVLDRYFRYIDE